MTIKSSSSLTELFNNVQSALLEIDIDSEFNNLSTITSLHHVLDVLNGDGDHRAYTIVHTAIERYNQLFDASQYQTHEHNLYKLNSQRTAYEYVYTNKLYTGMALIVTYENLLINAN